jgi:hypothetical protein
LLTQADPGDKTMAQADPDVLVGPSFQISPAFQVSLALQAYPGRQFDPGLQCDPGQLLDPRFQVNVGEPPQADPGNVTLALAA